MTRSFASLSRLSAAAIIGGAFVLGAVPASAQVTLGIQSGCSYYAPAPAYHHGHRYYQPYYGYAPAPVVVVPAPPPQVYYAPPPVIYAPPPGVGFTFQFGH